MGEPWHAGLSVTVQIQDKIKPCNTLQPGFITEKGKETVKPGA